MDLGLEGLRALVTGGTRGIGRAIVATLVEEGCDVAFCARNEDAVRAYEQALAASGRRVLGSPVDLAAPEAVEAWTASSAEALGGVDIVVANASALAVAPVPESWRAGFATDLMGTVRVFEAALPWLERSDAGAVVAIVLQSESIRFGLELDAGAKEEGAAFLDRLRSLCLDPRRALL